MKKLLSKTALGLALAVGGLAAAPAAAQADNGYPSYPQTKYLCQKCYGGCWKTVYVCYSYPQAMAWYNRQPSNARVLAQK